MAKDMVIQGRRLNSADIDFIRGLLGQNPDWTRRRLSRELCEIWDWRNEQGLLKDMAARSLLLKLEGRGYIRLPAPKVLGGNRGRDCSIPEVEHAQAPIQCELHKLHPLEIRLVSSGSEDSRLFNWLLKCHHYLGHRRTVGENLRYLIYDCQRRPLACLLFGSAAWKCADRDAFIGWDRAAREVNLQKITNNTRLLILPWVRVEHLASHLLGAIMRRLQSDWQAKYGHAVEAVETYVDRSRFRGTCYRAANWICLGRTKGRTRNDTNRTIRAPVKDIYLYPLSPAFRKELCND